jgi:hypothetical protein
MGLKPEQIIIRVSIEWVRMVTLREYHWSKWERAQ